MPETVEKLFELMFAKTESVAISLFDSNKHRDLICAVDDIDQSAEQVRQAVHDFNKASTPGQMEIGELRRVCEQIAAEAYAVLALAAERMSRSGG